MEVKLLGEHEEELSQKIIELEALCKKLREDTQRLEEEKATLEGMVESRDELLMEIAREMELDHMGVKEMKRKKSMPMTEEMPPHPLLPHHHHLRPLLLCLRRSTKKVLWGRSLSKKPRCHMRSSRQMLSP
jgi:hypothetical protein